MNYKIESGTTITAQFEDGNGGTAYLPIVKVTPLSNVFTIHEAEALTKYLLFLMENHEKTIATLGDLQKLSEKLYKHLRPLNMKVMNDILLYNSYTFTIQKALEILIENNTRDK